MTIRRILWVVAAAGLALGAQAVNPALYSGMKWRMAGPFRAGRTVAAAGNANQLDTYYMGSVDGGVWKTVNDGTTWAPIFDHEPVASIGAIAVAPSDPNIIYVGTGENDPRSQFSEGDGMFKSTDAGKTWSRIGLEATRQIGRILVDPKDPNRVFVAALGNVYAATPDRGVYRSDDGGQTWKKVLFNDDNTGAIDLSFAPGNPQVIYAALWATRRPPWSVYPAGHGKGSGLYKSTDGGDTWTHLTNGLPADPGRIGVDVAPSDANRVYAMVDADAKEGGLYRSDDAGATWKHVNNDTRTWGRGWYFESVTVDPQDANTIYAINTTVYKSTDGGENFDAFRGAPGGDDYHQLWINPEHHERMVLASDQGTIVTVNGGVSWSSWNNQPTAQLYDVTTDNRDPYWIYGAQQDSNNNGGAAASSGPNGTRAVFGSGWSGECAAGESGGIAADPLATDELYGGTVSKCTPSTGQRASISPLPAFPGVSFRKTWTLPLTFSEADPHELFFSNQFLFETDNGGNSWRRISPDLTRENPGVPPNLDPETANDITYAQKTEGPRWGVIYSIGPSPLEPHEVWVGTDDGYIQLTRDDGKTWTNVTPPALTAWSKVIKIKASHFNAEEAFAAVDRHRLNDNHPYIYRTTDGGKSWTNVVNGIPSNQFVMSLIEDPVRKGLLFCGTNLGVYVSFDNGADWQSLRLNMPPVEIRDFTYHGKALVIATFGRSFWVLDDMSPLRQASVAMNDAPAVLYKPEPGIIPAGQGRDYAGSDPVAALAQLDPMLVISADAPPSGAVIHYYIKSANGPVTLDIVNSAGKVVRHYSSDERAPRQNPRTMTVAAVFARTAPVLSAEPGSHAWSWDFREVTPGAAAGGRGRGGFGRGGFGGGTAAGPGMYSVRLTVDGKTYTQPLTVKLGKGATYTPESAEQKALAAQIQAVQARVATARGQATQVRSQLVKLESQASGSLAEAIAALAKQTGEVEGVVTVAPNPDASGEGDATPAPGSLTGLNSILGQLAGVAASGPVATAQEGFTKAKAMAESALAKWNQLKTAQVAALNRQLQQANLTPVDANAAGGRAGRGGRGGRGR